MNPEADKVYQLLPALYRIRDAEQGGVLRALCEVLAEDIAVLRENLDQLYDDQFIETCADWVAPYIGDLIGYRTLHGVTERTRSAARRWPIRLPIGVARARRRYSNNWPGMSRGGTRASWSSSSGSRPANT
jgi:hypothetical protein